MTSVLYTYGFLHIVYSDGSFRNRMMTNFLDRKEILARVPIPSEFQAEGFDHVTIKQIAATLTAPAYVETTKSMGRYGSERIYSSIYFENDADAMAFKLLYDGND